MLVAALSAVLLGAGPAPTPEALLRQAQDQYEALDLEDAIRTTTALLARPGVPEEVFVPAQVIRGSALAVLGRIIEAEAPFRLVLRVRADFELPEETPPKILAVFRKVQADERALARELEEIRRQRTIAELEVRHRLPETHVGGRPLPLRFTIDDPRGVLQRATFSYRLGMVGDYDTVSLSRVTEREWRAELVGDRTANDGGVTLCWYLQTFGPGGVPLARLGAEAAPETLQLSDGDPSDHAAVVKQWWFWTVVGAVAVAGAASAVLIARSESALPDSDLGVVSF